MPSISICLSGGGARGMAHVGVLKYLYEKGYEIKALSGTSAGSIVGAFIADGYHPAEIESLILTRIKKIPLNRHPLRQGLVNVDFLTKLVRDNLRSKNIEDLSIPFFANATHYESGVGRTFTQGPIVDTIIASSSIPIVFPPVLIDDTPYVDGGLSNNFNVPPLKNFAFPIVGVFVNPLVKYDPQAPFRAQCDRVIHLGLRESVLTSIPLCDTYIEPMALKGFTVFEVKGLKAISDIGYESAKATFESV
jgi:NTE family protein